MIFTSLDYLLFVVAAFSVYWALPSRMLRNTYLLIGSYIFYGYLHPWLCLLLAGITLVNYGAAQAMEQYPSRKRLWLTLAVVFTLTQLGFFKYFGFFIENISLFAKLIDWRLEDWERDILLPVGISFYSFQAIGYTVDVYRGDLAPRRNIIDFSLFVSFFPQLVAGPIERASHLLPQFELKRSWQWERFYSAWPLLITGYLKKMVIADNVAVFSNKVFALKQPSMFLMFAGTAAFALQIYADFSAYTDIARGSGRLLGFDLARNFNAPYSAVSPPDFWRRWHISFSTWIRDYLYIPLGGSRTASRWQRARTVFVTLGLSGLWHGAAWHFVAWGIYHGMLILLYRALGMGSKWHPRGEAETGISITVMVFFTLIGWSIFRAPSLEWLFSAMTTAETWWPKGDTLVTGLIILLWTAVYSLPMLMFKFVEEDRMKSPLLRAALLGLFLLLIVVFTPEKQQDFIYFQF